MTKMHFQNGQNFFQNDQNAFSKWPKLNYNKYIIFFVFYIYINIYYTYNIYMLCINILLCILFDIDYIKLMLFIINSMIIYK